MSLKQEIRKELVDLAGRVRDRARKFREQGRKEEAKHAATLAEMLKIWAQEWK